MKNANNATLYTASEPHFLIVSERAAILEIVTRKNKFFCQKSALSTKALRTVLEYVFYSARLLFHPLLLWS